MDNYFFNSLQYKLLKQQEHVVGLPDKNEWKQFNKYLQKMIIFQLHEFCYKLSFPKHTWDV